MIKSLVTQGFFLYIYITYKIYPIKWTAGVLKTLHYEQSGFLKPLTSDNVGFDSSSNRYYNKNELEECRVANKKFTEEDMKHLRASPYVLDVSPSIVHF